MRYDRTDDLQDRMRDYMSTFPFYGAERARELAEADLAQADLDMAYAAGEDAADAREDDCGW